MKTGKLIGKLFDISFKTAAAAREKAHRPFCSAILAAAGSSQRMGEDKLMMELNGRPVIEYAISALRDCEAVDEIIIVCRRENIAKLTAMCRFNAVDKVAAVIEGGATRLESVAAGLKAVSSKAELVAVHDAARPFADSEFIASVIAQAKGRSGAVPAIPVKDTVKLAKDGVIINTPQRDELFKAQTPQVFDADLFRAAIANAAGHSEITDDSMAVELVGGRVAIVSGLEDNIKLTTPMDMKLAELLIAQRGAGK